MQPTPKQAVPSTSPVPTQPNGQSSGQAKPQPLPLDSEALRQVGGGLGTPRGNW